MQNTDQVLRDIRELSYTELEDILKEMGQASFRAKQIYQWLWQKGAVSFDNMSNISKALRDQLAERFILTPPDSIARQLSSDGSRKYLLRLDSKTTVECVGMPSQNRLAVCVSSQAGCPMACAFCATGKSGFNRNLKAWEIYYQVLHVQNDFNMRVSSLVLMGQGEPFLNYDEVIKALKILNSKDGLDIGARHITVSSCGLIPQIRRFAREKEQFTLAISLHSAVQKTRNLLMPHVQKYSLLRLHEAMQDYVDKTKRRPTYEYALIKGVNDTPEELSALCDFCRGTLSHVNLIRLNEVKGSDFLPSSDDRVKAFVKRLEQAGVEVSVRQSRGSDIDAACGQLQQHYMRR